MCTRRCASTVGTTSASFCLCRYVARPPLCQDRRTAARRRACALHVQVGVEGRDLGRAPRPARCDLIEHSISRLCALIPPPRLHMVRYHGVIAGNASARAEVVPGRAPIADEQLALFTPADGGPLQPPPPTRHPWASLLRRVFAIDIADCPTCAGPHAPARRRHRPGRHRPSARRARARAGSAAAPRARTARARPRRGLRARRRTGALGGRVQVAKTGLAQD